MVDHNILLHRLEISFSFSGVPLQWIRSYLNGRTQSILFGGKSTAPRPAVYGVPQGSVLGPLLFTLYMANIGKVISNMVWVITAMQITHVESIHVRSWCSVLCNANAPNWEISFRSPRWLKWMCHHHFTTSRYILMRVCPWQNMWIIWCVRALTNFIESNLFDVLWQSPLQHASWIPSLLPELTIVTASSPDYRSTNSVDIAARIVYGQACFEHIMLTLCDWLHWLCVPQRIDFKRCILVFKALHGLASVYIKNYCVEVSSRRYLRSSHRRLIILPPSKTVLFVER